VHIVFDLKRHIVVNHQLDIFHIKPTTSNIGRDEDVARLPIFETLKNAVSFCLALVSMDSFYASHSVGYETLDEVINAFLGLAKYDDSCEVSGGCVYQFVPS